MRHLGYASSMRNSRSKRCPTKFLELPCPKSQKRQASVSHAKPHKRHEPRLQCRNAMQYHLTPPCATHSAGSAINTALTTGIVDTHSLHKQCYALRGIIVGRVLSIFRITRRLGTLTKKDSARIFARIPRFGAIRSF